MWSAATNPATTRFGGSDMIVRLWSAHAGELQSQAYLDHLRGNVLPRLRGLDGYAGATLLSRRMEGEVEVLVATLWRSLEAIREFAGPDLEAAVVADEAATLLSKFDRRVRHYELTMTDVPEGSR